MSVTLLNVLNTVTALGTDVSVDANGYLNLQGTPAFKASSIDSITITPKASEQLQITTVTPTAVNDAIYSLPFVYTDANSGMIESVPLIVTSDSTASAIEICDAFRALITGNTALNNIVSVNAAGSATLVLTAKAGFPIFSVATSDAKLAVVTGTLGITSVGTGTALIAQYPSTAGYYNAGGFNAAASIVATNNYTQVLVTSTTGSSAEILVNFAAANYNDLFGTYGTITGLKAGYRVTGGLITGTASTLSGQTQTVTSGVLATTDGILPGDFLVSVTTPVISRVVSVLSDTTYVSSNATVLTSASTINGFKWRALPL